MILRVVFFCCLIRRRAPHLIGAHGLRKRNVERRRRVWAGRVRGGKAVAAECGEGQRAAPQVDGVAVRARGGGAKKK